MTKYNEEWNRSEQSKAAVDQSPLKRNAANGASDEGEREHTGAGDQSKLNDPLIANWIDQRTKEGDSKDQMGEGQPIGSIGEEWRTTALVIEGLVDMTDPMDHAER